MSPDRDIPSARSILAGIPYFESLDPDALHTLERAAVGRVYGPGQIVFLEGEPSAGLYIVEEGWLKAVKISPGGREQVLRFVGPGEIFSEISVLLETPNAATMIALERAKVWIVQREVVLQLLDEYPRLARLLAQSLAERMLYIIQLVEDLSLRTVEARLARLLLEGARGDTVRRRRWTTQAEMAARMGTVPDVLNRALRALVEEGLIQVDRHQIQILDRNRLAARAEGSE
jgi:CRP-like cAMP-binding protein